MNLSKKNILYFVGLIALVICLNFFIGIGIISSYAEVGDAVTSDLQVEYNSNKFPADGSKIEVRYPLGDYTYMDCYDDGTAICTISSTPSISKGSDYDMLIDEYSDWIKDKSKIKTLILRGSSYPIYGARFAKLTNLTTLIIDGKVSLSSVISSKNSRSVGSPMFYGATNLTDIVILKDVSVGDGHGKYKSATPFQECKNINHIVIGKDVTTTGATNIANFFGWNNYDITTSDINPFKESRNITFEYLGEVKVTPEMIFKNNISSIKELTIKGDSSISIGTDFPSLTKVHFNGCNNSNITSNTVNEVSISNISTIGNISAPITKFTYDSNLKEIGNLSNFDIKNISFSDLTNVGDITNFSEVAKLDIPNKQYIPVLDGCKTLSQLKLQSTVDYTTLKDKQFQDCSNLELDLSKFKVENIGNCAFNAIGKLKIDTDSIKTIADYGFKGTSFETDTLKFRNYDSIGANAFEGSNVKTLYLLNKDETLNTNILKNANKLTKVYWLSDIEPDSKADSINSTVMVYCIKDSSTETWCKNNNVAYKDLNDEEVEALEKGKLPELVNDTKLFDISNATDITFFVSLGSKPAGANGISEIIIDNIKLPSTAYLFNGSDTITIKAEYLKTLSNGIHSVSILFDNGTFKSGASVTVISNQNDNDSNIPPEALTTIKYEFYKDYPDHVIIPVVMNGATSITKFKIGSNEVDPASYELQDGAIILKKDYLGTLDSGKYRVLPTFDDIKKTTISNIQLIVYEEAADRAAPYLLQSRIVFEGKPVTLKFDPGEGDLLATNVLALVIDNKLVLQNGNTKKFTLSNIEKIQNENTEIKSSLCPISNEDISSENIIPSKATPSEAIPSKATPSEAQKSVKLLKADEVLDDFEIIDINSTKTEKAVKDIEATPSQALKIMNSLVTVSDEKVPMDNAVVFSVDGTEITLSGNYVKSMNLTAGDHLIGAIFENSERTTDVRKVILTIPKASNTDNNNADNSNADNSNADENDSGMSATDNGKSEDSNDNGSSSYSSGGSSSSSESSNSGNGSVADEIQIGNNSNNKPIVPNNGGKIVVSTDNPYDQKYVKSDGTVARDEWVGDGSYWYHANDKGKLDYDWYLDKDNKWYKLSKDINGNFGAAQFGWVYQMEDGKWYYLSTETTEMEIGWQKIDNKYYYLTAFNEEQTYFGNNINGWKYDSLHHARPYGSMYCNEKTPDGYVVDETGARTKKVS